MNDAGIGKRAAKHVPVTTLESRHLRLQYVTEHVDWNQEQLGSPVVR